MPAIPGPPKQLWMITREIVGAGAGSVTTYYDNEQAFLNAWTEFGRLREVFSAEAFVMTPIKLGEKYTGQRTDKLEATKLQVRTDAGTPSGGPFR